MSLADEHAGESDSNQPGVDPSVREALAAAARRSAVGHVAPGEAPTSSALLAAMGGIRGLVESILPGLAFLVIFTITQELVASVVAPVVVALGFVVARVVSRTPVSSALVGVLGVALSAGLALITGRAEDNFVLGFVINSLFLIAILVSVIARRPLVGLIATFLVPSAADWREDKAKFRVALIATVLWAALFALRLAVELPLYFAEATQALATAKLLLGVPLYAGVLWVTWLLMRTAYGRSESA
ncbi:DUF3159 domain-containing protein [Salinibacterium sp. SWN1162]|uniref:DUF3159 domain-containing protein n=1 Tax=Salinibacterium sp. SWN1162 TaxID=2792053 RepID=UPI0018CD1D5E|nr:DUF3159 domain-containing protein [Salinibacterium sp. SWN1162]MBH0009241.1 DUF3159 domain-containing protein [Salinibacterium sp. SWN1162]